MLKNATVRLAVRAAVAGVSVFVATLQANATWDSALLKSAVTAALLASLEFFTPLNPTVGK
jgi:hypothetical protein